jgi:tetratricopeptide (TPR) repeat protein
MMTSKNRLCLPVAVIAIGLVAFPAQAAPRKATVETESSTPAKARELRDKGIVAMNLGRYDDAVALLEEAYEQLREPSILLDLVQAHRLNGNPERALVLCASFLRSSPNLTPKNRVEVEKTVAELGIIVEQIRLDGRGTRPSKTAPAKSIAKVSPPAEKPLAVEPPKTAKPEPVVEEDESAEGAEEETPKEKEDAKPPLPLSAANPSEIVKVEEAARAAELTKSQPPAEEKSRSSWLRSPWLWTAAGVVVAGIVTSVVVYESTKDPGAPRTSWGSQKVF